MNPSNVKISCIMPAYNEGPRIGNVLSVACKHHLIDEIIVIDDGSIDNTRDVALQFEKVNFIQHEKNKGKTLAIITGLTHAKNDLVCFLDADLVDLSYENITDLIEPVLQNKVGVSISMRKNSPWIDRVIGIDYISGERVYNKHILDDHLKTMETLPKFGMETFLNSIIIKNKIPIHVVFWKNVESPYKAKKLGKKALLDGFLCEVDMIRDIVKVTGIFGVVNQFIQMRRLMK